MGILHSSACWLTIKELIDSNYIAVELVVKIRLCIPVGIWNVLQVVSTVGTLC